ncbi:putative molybdopterin binding domain-containing protein [Candidatus Electrothrix aarhusensis]|uniref:Putative molybdopterin binding domain-containing protein n=1 Tax=Candidatus Electrothrix aarhusensis TaxID=1859131 RepID=A0A444IY55_9BACT|nr:putative molybdopterin binding domain-containing protein [Candidatus Electrothrix aarhusensis]
MQLRGSFSIFTGCFNNHPGWAPPSLERGDLVENDDVRCATMIGEIIAIGNELTSGRITNTTSAFAARELFRAGHEIYAMHTIGDTPTLIGEA